MSQASETQKFQPSMFGSNVVMKENPFIVDDINGKQNKIINSIKTPTNCLVYRNQPPTIHIIGSEYPQVLNINQRGLNEIPAIPDYIRILLMKENAVRTLIPLSGHPSLELIDLSQNLIESVDFETIPFYLKALILASNAIVSISTQKIFQNLQVLNLSGNKLNNFRFDCFPVLKTLNLSCNSFTKFEINSSTLIELSIQNNSLSQIDVVNAKSLTHIDFSYNYLTDFSFVEKIPTLTHLTGFSNKFQDNWASFCVALIPNLKYINGKEIKDGERAIHRDRVAKFFKSTHSPHPHKEISKIRLMMRDLKAIQVEEINTDSNNIEDVWMNRSTEREKRIELIKAQAQQIPCISNMNDEDEVLTIYGGLMSDEYMNKPFRSLRLQFVPIIEGTEIVKHVMNLAQQMPVMLTLDHNMLSSVSDMLFLTAFEMVEVLNVEGNPITRMSLFRPLMSFLIPSLQVINGIAITTIEKMEGIKHFQSLFKITRGIELVTGLENMDENQ